MSRTYKRPKTDNAERRITEVRPTKSDVYFTPEELAARWGMGVQSLANMRSRGDGPRFYRMENRLVRYPDWAIFDFELGAAAS